jgi:CHAT domain-containing protein/Flp pilus assembly protein TadD
MKKATAFFLFLIFVMAIPAQRKDDLRWQQWYQQADELYNLEEPTTVSDSTALQLFLQVAQQATPAVAIKSLIKAGNIHQGYQRFAAANQLYHQSINSNSKPVLDSVSLYEAWLYLGSSHYFGNIIDSAQHYFESASQLAEQYRGADALPEQDRLYNSLGAIYYESANYGQAKNYFTRALQFARPGTDGYEDFYNGIQSNIASCLMKLNRFEEALRILQSLSPLEQDKDLILQNKAHSFFELGRYDSALAIYQALPLDKGFAGVVALTDLGRIYMIRKQWQQAEAVFDSAIALNKKTGGGLKNKEEALAYLYRSQLAKEQGLIDEALTWANEALAEVHLNFSWKKAEDLPDDVAKSVSPIALFQILQHKALLLHRKYAITRQSSFLTASVNAYKKAIETANVVKSYFDNDEARLFFNNNYKPIYHQAAHTVYQAIAADAATVDDYLFVVENYKGNVLHQNLQNVLLKSAAGIPEAVRRREKELRQLLSFYTTRINQNANSKDAPQLQERYLSLQVELSRLQKNYERDEHYNLYKQQFAVQPLQLKAIQQRMDNNTALLHYFQADSVLYGLAIAANGFLLKELPLAAAYKNNLQAFLGEVYRFEEGRRYEGFDASAQLYRTLLYPFESLTSSAKQWVVLPDGDLFYLPFEALVYSKQQRDYVLLHHSLSYHYSFALLFGKQKQVETGAPKNVLAFAPFSQADSAIDTTGMPGLQLSGKEATAAGTQVFTGRSATKKLFLQRAGGTPVLHLATHASIGADSGSNWIQFYPTPSADAAKLMLHEIYNLDLHKAELVVLSACETAGGAQAGGEGLLSLSRAFLYAGANGIVATLWKTEDRITAYLMQRMHGYLRENRSPQWALHQAKKDLLADESIGAQYKTPNYWANFIYVGTLPEPRSSFNWWWLVGAVALLLVLGMVYRKNSACKAESFLLMAAFQDRIQKRAV